MIVLRRKAYSGSLILNTHGAAGFIRGRKYDTDLDRLGRMKTSQRELQRVGDIGQEIRKMNAELRGGIKKQLEK